MEISFVDARLKHACETLSERMRKWGQPAAKNLKSRLDDLRAARCMEDMRNLPGRWEELTGERRGVFSCRLDKALRLILRPSRQPPPSRKTVGWTGNTLTK